MNVCPTINLQGKGRPQKNDDFVDIVSTTSIVGIWSSTGPLRFLVYDIPRSKSYNCSCLVQILSQNGHFYISSILDLAAGRKASP